MSEQVAAPTSTGNKGKWLSNLSPEQRREIALKGVEARLANLEKKKRQEELLDEQVAKLVSFKIHSLRGVHEDYTIYGREEDVKVVLDLGTHSNTAHDIEADLRAKIDALLNDCEEQGKVIRLLTAVVKNLKEQLPNASQTTVSIDGQDVVFSLS